MPLDRLGIVRRDHAPGKDDVGEVLPIGVEAGIGQIRRPDERELLSGGGRKRALGR